MNLKNLSDEKIVELVCKKDKEIFSEIIKRYQKKLFQYINYLTQDKEKTKDIVQETFVKSYINLNSFNTKKKFSSWIYRIAHNQAMNFFNKNKNQVSLDEKINLRDNFDLEEEVIKKEIKNNLNQCLEKLPIIYKEAIILYYLEEKSYEEISDILKIPIGTVSVRINRSKSLLKKICQK